MFIPKLFIFVGEFNHFFTLRVSYQYEYFVRGRRYVETRYSHIKNLSQNWDEAVEKAREAEKQLGIQLVVHENREKQLDEIKRLSHEEKENQRRAAEEEHRIAQEEQDRKNRENWVNTVRMITDRLAGIVRNEDTEEEYVEMLRDCCESSGKEFTEELESKARAKYNPIASHKPELGRMIYGAFDRTLLTEIPVRYLQWLVYKSGLCDVEDTYSQPMAIVAQWLRDNYNVPAPVESQWVGEVGSKVQTELTLQGKRSFEGAYGLTWIYDLVDSTGNTFIWFASKPALSDFKNGSKINLKFTIKAHNEFKGEKQTAITRARVA